MDRHGEDGDADQVVAFQQAEPEAGGGVGVGVVVASDVGLGGLFADGGDTQAGRVEAALAAVAPAVAAVVPPLAPVAWRRDLGGRPQRQLVVQA